MVNGFSKIAEITVNAHKAKNTRLKFQQENEQIGVTKSVFDAIYTPLAVYSL
jgi:hypothetical protein